MGPVLKMEYDSIRAKDVIEFFHLFQKYEELVHTNRKLATDAWSEG